MITTVAVESTMDSKRKKDAFCPPSWAALEKRTFKELLRPRDDFCSFVGY